MGSLIKDIPEEKQGKRGWKVEVNGQKIEKVARVRIYNEKFGELNYGLTLGGYDGWSFREIGGGGAVTVPFIEIIKNDIESYELYVGMLRQDRPNQGGKVLNVPRGFLNPGEKHFEAAERELKEETGYASQRVTPLSGEPANPNSTFFETTELDEGVKFFSFEVVEEEVEIDPEESNDKYKVYKFKEGILKPVSKNAENIVKCRFYPWYIAATRADMFSNTFVVRLLAKFYIDDIE